MFEIDERLGAGTLEEKMEKIYDKNCNRVEDEDV